MSFSKYGGKQKITTDQQSIIFLDFKDIQIFNISSINKIIIIQSYESLTDNNTLTAAQAEFSNI
jgi:hypothetical protein